MTKFSLFSSASFRRLPLSGFAPALFALSLSLGTLSLTACGDEQTAFDQTPTQRSQNAVEDLRRELIADILKQYERYLNLLTNVGQELMSHQQTELAE